MLQVPDWLRDHNARQNVFIQTTSKITADLVRTALVIVWDVFLKKKKKERKAFERPKKNKKKKIKFYSSQLNNNKPKSKSFRHSLDVLLL